ncbi:hypothetical protein [Rhizobium sp. FKL33]|uniref:hypothetical protein n=1 Tax=Rhizobium sp. FKL33 TaxID=2562307 RepID=UPI0010BFA63C|nr:hypothetical protein [Rhizobium sp. FKL33]
MAVTKTATPAGVGAAQTERDPGLGAPVDVAARGDENDKRLGGPIANGASDKNAHQRRTGGSANDPMAAMNRMRRVSRLDPIRSRLTNWRA